MLYERDVDSAAIYEAKRRDFVRLVGGLDAAQQATVVAATPAWTVLDVLAHVVGITADLNAGNLGQNVSGDEWTDAQVRSRRGRTLADLADEWERESERFAEGIRLFGYEIGSHYVGDLLQHESDVRHAVGLAPPSDDLTLAVATDFYIDAFHRGLSDARAGTVVIHSGHETFITGTGPTVATLTASRYELFRSLGGRRSANQIRKLDWEGDAGAIVPLVSQYPPPHYDLVEAQDP